MYSLCYIRIHAIYISSSYFKLKFKLVQKTTTLISDFKSNTSTRYVTCE